MPYDVEDIVAERVAKRTEQLGEKARQALGFGAKKSEGGLKITGGKIPEEGKILRNKKTGKAEFIIQDGRAVPYEE